MVYFSSHRQCNISRLENQRTSERRTKSPHTSSYISELLFFFLILLINIPWFNWIDTFNNKKYI